MPRKKAVKYGPGGQYLRRRLRSPDGKYVDVYGKDAEDLQHKVSLREAEWLAEEQDTEDLFFVEYAAAWYQRVQGDMTERRRDVIRREINRNICPVIGTKRLSEITSDDVADVMAARSGLSKSAQEKTLQCLRRILDAAADAGKIPRNPAARTKAGGRKAEPKAALTKEQETSLLAAISGMPVELPIRLGLYLGLRREEVYGLQWQDVRLDGAAPYVTVRHVCRWPKNSRPELSTVLKSDAAFRTIPIPPALLPHLQRRKAEAQKDARRPLSGRTVIEMPEGGPWTYQAHKSAWRAVEARTAGVVKIYRKDPETGAQAAVAVQRRLGDAVPHHPDVIITLDFPCSSHILRHTYITRLILGGVDVKRVQYLAGHASAQVTLEIYTSLMGHRPEDLIDDVSGIFPG